MVHPELTQDHPLNVNSNSKFKQYYDDQKVWEMIEKDVKRTRSDLMFFSSAYAAEQNTEANVETLEQQHKTKKADLTAEQSKCYIESHADVLSRILFIYAKLNKAIQYVQGMNEVCAVIYYMHYKQGRTQSFESDVFFGFSLLMGELKDGFIRQLDNEDSGIFGRCKHINNIVKTVDLPVWNCLARLKVETQYYALRWIMVLMCQEFTVPDVIRLWDSLFADPQRFDFIDYVCVQAVLTVRTDILKGDFAKVMEVLQTCAENVQDVQQLIQDAIRLKDRYAAAIKTDKF